MFGKNNFITSDGVPQPGYDGAHLGGRLSDSVLALTAHRPAKIDQSEPSSLTAEKFPPATYVTGKFDESTYMGNNFCWTMYLVEEKLQS